MATCDAPDGASAPALPHEFPRRILLAALGLTPRRLTEALYALIVPADGGPPFVPTAIHVVTTTRGRDRARRELLDRETGRFLRFCADCRLDPSQIAFDDDSFIVVERDGRPLEDITTAADHAAAAEALVRLVRRLTSDDDAAIHASLAGGRRTIALYLGHALSLYGRPQDRLSHVVVDPRFADHAFHYPPVPPATLVIRGRRVNTADARVTLADVPFFRLRAELPLRVIDELPPPGATGTHASLAAATPTIELHLRRNLLIAGGETVPVPPANFAFYAVMARRCAQGRDFVNCRTPNLASEYLQEYTKVTADRWAPNVERVRHRLRNGADSKWFEQRKTRVNRAIRIALGAWLGRPYLIASRGGWRDRRFGLAIDPAHISFPED